MMLRRVLLKNFQSLTKVYKKAASNGDWVQSAKNRMGAGDK
jgi:hypothetical protein